MKTSAYAAARDSRIADDVADDREQMCPARGCPYRWSVTGERGKACGAHYFAGRADWPRITELLQRAEDERAAERAREVPAEPMSWMAKREILDRLRKLGKDPGSARGWAEWLRGQHAAGRRLTRFQIEAVRRVGVQL